MSVFAVCCIYIVITLGAPTIYVKILTFVDQLLNKKKIRTIMLLMNNALYNYNMRKGGIYE